MFNSDEEVAQFLLDKIQMFHARVQEIDETRQRLESYVQLAKHDIDNEPSLNEEQREELKRRMEQNR